MASRDLDDLHPDLHAKIDELADLCDEAGFDLLVYCTYRSPQEQDALYAQGRTEPGRIVTYLRGGESKHNAQDVEGLPCARACDCAPMVGGKLDWRASNPLWEHMGELAEGRGLVWGGRWKMRDLPHLELPEQP